MKCIIYFITFIFLVSWNTKLKETNISSCNLRKGTVEKTDFKDKIICDRKDSIVTDSEDPIIIKTCYFGKYKSVSLGSADYKGRYSYDYKILLKSNTNYIKIENHKMFNNKQNELLEIINNQIEEEYNELKNDKNTSECFVSLGEFKRFKMDDFGIEFNDDGMEFNCSFGLGDYCFNADRTSVMIKLNVLEKYFVK